VDVGETATTSFVSHAVQPSSKQIIVEIIETLPRTSLNDMLMVPCTRDIDISLRKTIPLDPPLEIVSGQTPKASAKEALSTNAKEQESLTNFMKRYQIR